MSNNLSAKYYQENKERLQKKKKRYGRESYQNLSNEENEKIDSMVVNVKEIFQKMKNKTMLSIEKIL